MSFLQRHHLPWLVFVIDLLAIAMVIVIAFLIARAFPERGINEQGLPPSLSEQAPRASPDIQKEYAVALRSLTAILATFNGSSLELLQKVREALFSMRVPGALRDAHLNAVLTIGQLQGSIAGASSAEVKARLQVVIEGLVGKE